jgi:hypothetical protein
VARNTANRAASARASTNPERKPTFLDCDVQFVPIREPAIPIPNVQHCGPIDPPIPRASSRWKIPVDLGKTRHATIMAPHFVVTLIVVPARQGRDWTDWSCGFVGA